MDIKDLGFPGGSAVSAPYGIQENLDVISWPVSWFSRDSEERWQDMLTLTVTGMACVTGVTPPLTGVQVHHLQQAGS